jgi:hypothetical protein
VIIRISTEGQYEVAEADVPGLNELDNAAVDACTAGDEASFRATYDRLLEYVRTQGRAVADDHLGGSDLILPPPDVTLEEAKTEFSGEGILPG